jgi:hypothetical protein
LPSARLHCVSETPPGLRPVDPANLAQALAYALRYDGRRRVRDAEELMARITAERLVRHLDRAGVVVMQKPPLAQHAAPDPV